VSELSDAELTRYARQIVLREVGGVGQRKIKAASVAVVGAGAIGSAAIPALAGAGVGRLTIIDKDVVELSNLHRQLLFADSDCRSPKAPIAAAFVARLNSNVAVNAVQQRIDAGNAAHLLEGHDYVLDGSDNFATRLAVSDACVRMGIPLVSAAAVMFQGQVGLFRAKPCYRCFVGDAFDAEDCDTCAEQGVLGALTGTIGNFAALILLRAITGVGDDHPGAVHLFDGIRLTWRTMRVPADPACRSCGAASDV
jgi:adenylyltransferase/sulfurtransferase